MSISDEHGTNREQLLPHCEYCDGECVPWEALPANDIGNGLCNWCLRAITKEWPAVQEREGENLTMHYHHCPYITWERT